MTEDQLKDIIANTGNDSVKRMAQAELQKIELVRKAAQGDNLASTLVALKEAVDKMKPSGAASSGVSKSEVQKMLKDVLKKSKISYDDLDSSLKAALAGNTKVKLELTVPEGKASSSGTIPMQELERPLFQRILSDMKARNNVYLYGMAGTGKTYMADVLAKFLGWELITVNCNQFTSQLELVGGQTITGYQRGKLEMAWGNFNDVGDSIPGAVLVLDELPKIDPNTAGILNEALAKVKDIKAGKKPSIRNGRGEVIEMQNIFILATGNVRLNETSAEYEANFKQDLSLQDRFVGSCYKVIYDYEFEYSVIMKNFLFIWNYMVKVREAIMEDRLTGFAFVSIRILQSLRDTYIVERDVEKRIFEMADGEQYAIEKPKTLKDGVDSFFDLFLPHQAEKLKKDTNYDEFIKVYKSKANVPIDELNTDAEIKEGKKLVDKNKKELEKLYGTT